MLYKTATIPGIPLMRICAHTHTHIHAHTNTHRSLHKYMTVDTLSLMSWQLCLLMSRTQASKSRWTENRKLLSQMKSKSQSSPLVSQAWKQLPYPSMMLINLIPTGTHSLSQDTSLLLQRKFHPRDREKERDTEEERERWWWNRTEDEDRHKLNHFKHTRSVFSATFSPAEFQSVSRTGQSLWDH